MEVEKFKTTLLEPQFTSSCDITDNCSILKLITKGQLISKCPYEKSVSSEIPTKKFPRFLP